ncbi:TPA: ABC-F family ATP-binding cassette domain-containing protein [Vibrio diabolicus]
MSILQVKNLSYQIADKSLYNNATFRINEGEKIGITGANGVGKSTLLKLFIGELSADKGCIDWLPNLEVGYLEQHFKMDNTLTVYECLKSAFENLYAAEQKLWTLYQAMTESHSTSLLSQVARLQAYLEDEDFYAIDTKIEQVAVGLGIYQFGLDTPLVSLSGGQRHKVLLGRLLLRNPDVLILDEPTNYLDALHIEWLVTFLNDYTGTALLVSHDIDFLNQVATSICDIDYQTVRKYSGTYVKAMQQKQHDGTLLEKQYKAQQNEIRKLEQFIAKNGAGVNASLAKGRKKKLDKIERIQRNHIEKVSMFDFAHQPIGQQYVIDAKALMIGYQQPLLPALDITLARGEKLVVSGFNGVGKSTLLKTLMGEIEPLSGEVVLAKGAMIGYFSQDLSWRHPQHTPEQELCSCDQTISSKESRKLLARFGVTGDKTQRHLDTLSGGEQTRVKLCCLSVQKCNVLLLDEPTTHLDSSNKNALKEALQRFSGSVIVVSHEKAFLQSWSDRVLDISLLTCAESETEQEVEL